jgi:hypothetical protein
VLSARTPEPQDIDSWLALWSPELGKADTSVILGRVEAVPAWAVDELAGLVGAVDHEQGTRNPVAVTARDQGLVPEKLRHVVDRVVHLPALRQRPEDVMRWRTGSRSRPGAGRCSSPRPPSTPW